jgi:hypothetical protein
MIITRKGANGGIAATVILLLMSIGLGMVKADDRLALQAPTPTLSTTPITLTVTGTVKIGTPGISLPSGLPLTLHIARVSTPGGLPSEIFKRDVALSASNTFRYDNIPAMPGDLAFVTTTFEGVVQGTSLVTLANGQATLDAPFTLYGATNDPTTINLINVQHVLDFKTGNVLQVLATHVYQNSSNRVYTSRAKTANGLPVSISIPLPVGARAIAFSTQPSSRFVVGGDVNTPVIQDTRALLPGEIQEVVFSYQVPYVNGALIDQDYVYPTSSLQILIPDDIKVNINDGSVTGTPKTDKFEIASNRTVSPERLHTQYTLRSPLKMGERLVYTLSGAARPVQSALEQAEQAQVTASVIVLLVLAGILIVIGGVVLAVRQPARRRRADAPRPATRTPKS